MEKTKVSGKPEVLRCQNCRRKMQNLRLFGGKYCYRCYMLKAKISDSKYH